VFHNGVRLVDGTDYTATNGTSLTLTTAAQNGDEVVVISYATFEVADAYTKAESDDRYVNVTGDTMTGSFGVGSGVSNRLALEYNTISGLATFGPNSTGGSSSLSVGTSDAGSFVPRMNITSTGNVGIGTSSPNRLLSLYATQPVFQITNVASGNTQGTIQYQVSGDTQFNIDNQGSGSGGVIAFLQAGAERMRIDSAGRVTMPYQPAFFARLNAQWTHPSGAVELGGTWVADLNVGSNYNTTTRRFTAPVAGNYQFNTTVGTVGGNAGVAYISSEIWVNGSRKYVGSWDSGGSSYNKSSASYVVALNANDYVTIASEINISVNLQEATHNTFSGYLIG